jgi:hypothetical protein
MIKVNIEGHGQFQINETDVPELLRFLSKKQQVVRIPESNQGREVIQGVYTGRDLLNG